MRVVVMEPFGVLHNCVDWWVTLNLMERVVWWEEVYEWWVR